MLRNNNHYFITSGLSENFFCERNCSEIANDLNCAIVPEPRWISHVSHLGDSSKLISPFTAAATKNGLIIQNERTWKNAFRLRSRRNYSLLIKQFRLLYDEFFIIRIHFIYIYKRTSFDINPQNRTYSQRYPYSINRSSFGYFAFAKKIF